MYTASKLDKDVNLGGLDSGYYHSSALSPSDSDHAVRKKRTYKHWSRKPLGSTYYWNTVALEDKYECEGTCKVKFSSAYDAWSSHCQKCGKKHGPNGYTGVEMWSCGTGTCPDAYIHWEPCKKCGVDVPQTFSGIPPMEFSIPEGWDGHEYICQQKVGLLRCTAHAFTCQTPKCPNADNHRSSSSQKSASLSGSSSASAGSSVTVSLSTATAFSKVYWYVAGPGESGLGSNVETDSGGSSSTSASLSYSFPSDASGDYVITAYIYNYSDSSIYQSSHTVSVSGSSSVSSDETPNCQDCTSHCSSPCSCTNSGTCNGTVTDNTPNCSDCTSHCSSPCSCSNSGTCNGTVSTPSPPSTPTL